MSEWRERLKYLGMIHTVAGGIQIDINAAVRRKDGLLIGGSLCDHNCTTDGGNYTCPAALSLNRGFLPNSFASADDILTGIDTVAQGLRDANNLFLRTAFHSYCHTFHIPSDIGAVFEEVIGAAPIEVNLFGGNPEMHPQIARIIAELRRRGDFVINFTTTGRRIMRDSAFAAQIMESPPDVLALSADDFEDADQVRTLRDMPLDALYREWKSIPWTHGQRQKAVEAVYVARMFAGKDSPQVLFNLVLHSGNLSQVKTIIAVLAESFPGCRINPFPAQSAFLYEPGSIDDLERLEYVIDWMIALHNQDSVPITRRLHYWLALKAACHVYRSAPRAFSDTLAGHQLWRCYKTFGANRYVQVGKASGVQDKRAGGGHLGCFWNDQTITRNDAQVWHLESQDIVIYLATDSQKQAAHSSNPCPGCAFPRLLFDVISTESGLSDALIPAYLDFRQKYAGY